MTNILEEIVAHKKMEIAALDVSALRRAGESVPAPRDFLAALSRRRNSPFLIGDGTGVRLSLIAELKRASPSKGICSSPRLISSGRHLCRKWHFCNQRIDG